MALLVVSVFLTRHKALMNIKILIGQDFQTPDLQCMIALQFTWNPIFKETQHTDLFRFT